MNSRAHRLKKKVKEKAEREATERELELVTKEKAAIDAKHKALLEKHKNQK